MLATIELKQFSSVSVKLWNIMGFQVDFMQTEEKKRYELQSLCLDVQNEGQEVALSQDVVFTTHKFNDYGKMYFKAIPCYTTTSFIKWKMKGCLTMTILFICSVCIMCICRASMGVYSSLLMLGMHIQCNLKEHNPHSSFGWLELCSILNAPHHLHQ